MMKSVIVTGANGFIGRNVCLELSRQGVEVVAVVEETMDNVACLSGSERIHVISCNLDRFDELKKLIPVKEYDAFYHFAWDGVFGPRSEDYHIQLSNISYTCKAVEIAENVNCRKFIYPSSVLEFDCMYSASKDEARPNMRYLYYSTKLTAHILAKTLCANKSQLSYIQAVISNIYGAGTLNKSFINNTLETMLKKQKTSFSSAEQLYDFIYIDDACRALSVIGERGLPFSMYYIGSGQPRQLRDYIRDMATCTHYDLPLGIGEINSAVSDINLQYVDVDKLHRETGFMPSVSFVEGISRTIQYLYSEKVVIV